MDPSYHLAALQNESRKMTSTIPNPIQRIGLENLMELGLSEMSGGWMVENRGRKESTISTHTRGKGTVGALPRSTSLQKIRSNTVHYFVVEGIFGSLNIRSTTRELGLHEDIEDEEVEYSVETSFTLHPSRWLQICGIGYGIQVAFSKSLKGLEFKMKTYNAVPDDAEIFELCKQGDVDGVKALFDQRCASPWDTNSKGFTPLFVSI